MWITHLYIGSFIITKFHKILLSGFRWVALTNCFTGSSIFHFGQISKFKKGVIPRTKLNKYFLWICLSTHYVPHNYKVSRNSVEQFQWSRADELFNLIKIRSLFRSEILIVAEYQNFRISERNKDLIVIRLTNCLIVFKFLSSKRGITPRKKLNQNLMWITHLHIKSFINTKFQGILFQGSCAKQTVFSSNFYYGQISKLKKGATPRKKKINKNFLWICSSTWYVLHN